MHRTGAAILFLHPWPAQRDVQRGGLRGIKSQSEEPTIEGRDKHWPHWGLGGMAKAGLSFPPLAALGRFLRVNVLKKMAQCSRLGPHRASVSPFTGGMAWLTSRTLLSL